MNVTKTIGLVCVCLQYAQRSSNLRSSSQLNFVIRSHGQFFCTLNLKLNKAGAFKTNRSWAYIIILTILYILGHMAFFIFSPYSTVSHKECVSVIHYYVNVELYIKRVVCNVSKLRYMSHNVPLYTTSINSVRIS